MLPSLRCEQISTQIQQDRLPEPFRMTNHKETNEILSLINLFSGVVFPMASFPQVYQIGPEDILVLLYP